MAGDQSDTLYIVRKGRMKLFRISESGKEQVLAFINPGEFTGELALFREVIMKDSPRPPWIPRYVPVERKDLEEILLKYPTISLKLLSEFSNRIENSEKQQTRYATEKVDTRIALFIAEA